MRRHHGQEGRVYIGVGGAAVMVCELNEWTLDFSTDRQEVTGFCDRNKVFVKGKPTSEGSLAGYWNSDSDLLFDAAEADDPVDLILYPSVLVPEQYWYGPVFMDASITVNAENPITVEGEFSAAGDFYRVGLATP
jgi:hypothetical protein